MLFDPTDVIKDRDALVSTCKRTTTCKFRPRMGRRGRVCVFSRLEVAGMIPVSSASIDYFSDNEWKFLTQKLSIAISVCSELAREYKCGLLIDSRWPATGLKVRNLLQTRYIRITLNHNYMLDKEIFFELREHTVVSIPFIYRQIKGSNFLILIPEDKIQRKEYIYSLLLPLLKRNAPDAT